MEGRRSLETIGRASREFETLLALGNDYLHILLLTFVYYNYATNFALSFKKGKVISMSDHQVEGESF